MNSQPTYGLDFIMFLAMMGLLVVAVLMPLYARLRGRPGHGVPLPPRPPSRAVRGHPARTPSVWCPHCPEVFDSVAEANDHIRFDCPGLNRR